MPINCPKIRFSDCIVFFVTVCTTTTSVFELEGCFVYIGKFTKMTVTIIKPMNPQACMPTAMYEDLSARNASQYLAF